MSRNLGRTDCYFCKNEVTLTESERPMTRDDCGGYYDDRGDGYAYAGAIVAAAECKTCFAKYLAWIDASSCKGYGIHPSLHRSEYGPFFDLSFRSSFNDEPGEEDLPEHTVKMVPVLGAWPRCAVCKKRIYYSYGCQCPGPLRLRFSAFERSLTVSSSRREQKKAANDDL
jgi:hypothetical protein